MVLALLGIANMLAEDCKDGHVICGQFVVGEGLAAGGGAAGWRNEFRPTHVGGLVIEWDGAPVPLLATGIAGLTLNYWNYSGSLFRAGTLLLALLGCQLGFAADTDPASEPASLTAAAETDDDGREFMPTVPVVGSGASKVSVTDYRIGPSDQLEIDVFQVEELSGVERVNYRGYIKLPLIGSVKVAGLTREEAEDLIAQMYAVEYLQDPQINIDIVDYVSQQVTVMGSVSKAGVYPLRGRTTLLQVLAMAGGPERLADLEEIVVFRTDKTGSVVGYVVNLEEIQTGEKVDPEVIGNDKVVVPESGSKSLIQGISNTLRGFIGFKPY